jgi:hypothetical protein
MKLMIALIEPRWQHLTSRSTGRNARLSRALQEQAPRQPRCAGELRRWASPMQPHLVLFVAGLFSVAAAASEPSPPISEDALLAYASAPYDRSTACTENTCFARSIPTVVISLMTSPSRM